MDMSFNTKEFHGWVKSQSPDRKYNYQNMNGDCAIGQFYASRGIKAFVGPEMIALPGVPPIFIPRSVSEAMKELNAGGFPVSEQWATFGELDRVLEDIDA